MNIRFLQRFFTFVIWCAIVIVGVSVSTGHGIKEHKRHKVSFKNPFLCHAFFAPDDNVQKVIVDCIDREQEQILLAMYMFTNNVIAQALCRAVSRGVKVVVVVDKQCVQDRYHKLNVLFQAGIAIFVYDPPQKAMFGNLMHHKFMVMSCNIGGEPLLVTGSFNFTKSACDSNQENIVVLNSKEIITQYKQQFDLLKGRCSYRYQPSVYAYL